MSLESFLQQSSNLEFTEHDKELNLYVCTYKKENITEQVKPFRSIIYDDNNKKIVSRSFPYTLELNQDDLTDLETKDFFVKDQWLFCKSHEGTLIQMYYLPSSSGTESDSVEGTWKVSTMRKLKAHDSNWGSRYSFGDQFDKSWAASKFNEVFFQSANKNLTYTFLLKPDEFGRIVCDVEENVGDRLVFAGTFTKEGQFQPPNFVDHHFLQHIPVQNFSAYVRMTIEDIKTYFSAIDIKKTQGIFGYNVIDNQFVKIYSTEYNNLKLLRAGENDFRRRYLLTMNDQVLHRQFREHYPKMAKMFRRLDGSVHALVKDILRRNTNLSDKKLVTYFDTVNFVPRNHKHVFETLKKLDVALLWDSVLSRMKRNVSMDETL